MRSRRGAKGRRGRIRKREKRIKGEWGGRRVKGNGEEEEEE